jgi:serine protease AprX
LFTILCCSFKVTFYFLTLFSRLDGTQPNPDLRPHTTSHSYGCPTFYCPNSEFLKEAAETLKQEGVFMIVSAGNSGPRCSTINRPPGHMANIFSVGASGTNTNLIASFSSRGPITLDRSNRIKPDITAPGVGVWSAVIGNRYASYSGTSMASPAVNGAVALIWNAVPELERKVDETIKLIQETAVEMTHNDCDSKKIPNNVYGWGVIDVLAAVDAAKKKYGRK